MVQYRTFHNSDPPQILKLWHASNMGPSAAEGFPCDILELFVFSQPFFDRKGFILATDGDRIAGFGHAAFACNPEGTNLDHSRGIISALLVHPDYRRSGVGAELVSHCEQYLTNHGATSIVAGGGLDSTANKRLKSASSSAVSEIFRQVW